MSTRRESGSSWLRLSALSARRTLPPALAVASVAVSTFLLARVFLDSSSSAVPRFDLARLVTSAAPRAAIESDALRFFFASHGVWAFAAVLFAPFLAWRAATQSGGSLRRNDRLWLDARPVSAWFVATAQVSGCAAAAGGCVALFALAVLVSQPASLHVVDAPAGAAAGPQARLLEEGLAWSDPELEAGESPLRARLTLRLVGGGDDPVLNLEFAARRLGAEEWSTALIRIGDGAALETELPGGPKGAEFELRRVQGGARALVRSREVSLYRPLSADLAVLRMAQRILMGLIASIALALGFGHYVSAPSATSAAVLPWVLALLAPSLPVFEYLPGGDLAHALEQWAEGRSAAALTPKAWMGTALLIALGLGLAASGRKRAEA